MLEMLKSCDNRTRGENDAPPEATTDRYSPVAQSVSRKWRPPVSREYRALPKACLKTERPLSLRGAAGDEAISFSSKDCFAEYILSLGEGLTMTRSREFVAMLSMNSPLTRRVKYTRGETVVCTCLRVRLSFTSLPTNAQPPYPLAKTIFRAWDERTAPGNVQAELLPPARGARSLLSLRR
jgi:hypothetical protein